jgi:hypothetical protein
MAAPAGAAMFILVITQIFALARIYSSSLSDEE